MDNLEWIIKSILEQEYYMVTETVIMYKEIDENLWQTRKLNNYNIL